MHHFLLALFLFSSAAATAQLRHAISLSGGALFSWQHVTSGEDFQVSRQSLKSFAEIERPRIGPSIRIAYQARLARLLYLRTGVEYAKYRWAARMDDLRWGTDFNGSDPPDPELFGIDWIETSYQHTFLTVPVLLRLEWDNPRLNPFVEAGLTGSRLLNGHATTATNLWTNPREETGAAKRSVYLGSELSVGLAYTLTDRISLTVQSRISYQHTPLWDTTIRSHVVAAGLETGARVRL